MKILTSRWGTIKVLDSTKKYGELYVTKCHFHFFPNLLLSSYLFHEIIIGSKKSTFLKLKLNVTEVKIYKAFLLN